MKTLLLVRHGEAYDNAHFADFDRPLTPFGEQQALELGLQFKQQSLHIDSIICSSAKRTLTTATLIAKQTHYPSDKIHVEPNIYNAEMEDLLNVVQQLGKEQNTVIIVGHNPGLSLLANYYQPDKNILLPTGGYAKISVA